MPERNDAKTAQGHKKKDQDEDACLDLNRGPKRRECSFPDTLVLGRPLVLSLDSR